MINSPPNMSGDLIEIALHEKPLSEAMHSYALRILLLSIVLSLIVAAFIFAALLARVLVRPIGLSSNITHFAGNPEESSRLIVPSRRSDELGQAERNCTPCRPSFMPCCNRRAGLAALEQGKPRSPQHADIGPIDFRPSGRSEGSAGAAFCPKLIGSLDRLSQPHPEIRSGRRAGTAARSAGGAQGLAADVLDTFALVADTGIRFRNDVPAARCRCRRGNS